MRGTRVVLTVAVGGLALTALTACSHDTTRPSPAPSVTTTVTRTASPSVSPSATSSGTVAPVGSTSSASSSSGTRTCSPSDTRLDATVLQPAMHNGAVALHVTDTGSTACVTTGYPGVAVVDATGNQVAQAAREPRGYQGGLPSSTSSAPQLTLQPGGEATALVEFSTTAQPDGTTCPTWPGLLVTLPDTTTSVRLTTSFTACLPTVAVNPLLTGATGRG